jgi:hypothetical protein
MIKKLALNLLLFSLVVAAQACGKGTSAPAKTVSVGSFAPYVSRFEDTSIDFGNAVKVDNLVVQFGQMDTPAEHGVCDITGDGSPPTITIDQAYWNQADENTREALIFHELGHCVLRRVHETTIAANGEPESMMYPYTMDKQVYAKYRQQYLQELYSAHNQF